MISKGPSGISSVTSLAIANFIKKVPCMLGLGCTRVQTKAATCWRKLTPDFTPKTKPAEHEPFDQRNLAGQKVLRRQLSLILYKGPGSFYLPGQNQKGSEKWKLRKVHELKKVVSMGNDACKKAGLKKQKTRRLPTPNSLTFPETLKQSTRTQQISIVHFSSALATTLKLIPILLSKSLGSLQALCCFGTAWTNCIKSPWSLSKFPWHISQ